MKAKSLNDLELDVRNRVIARVLNRIEITTARYTHYWVDYVEPEREYDYERLTKHGYWDIFYVKNPGNGGDIKVGRFYRGKNILEIKSDSLGARVLARTFYKYEPQIKITEAKP